MLTESEILDEQVQTLECALDKLADHEKHAVEPATVPDVDAGQALTTSVECMRAIVDLYHTISNEGVSHADIQALRNIQSKMDPYRTLKTKVALEAYEGMFTPMRSMINQTVSQEATLAEIGMTLKEWFFKIVDFVVKVVEWCRVTWNSEDAINLRLKVIDRNLQSMANQCMDVVKRNKTAGRDLNAHLQEIALLVLRDPKLPRTPATIMAFGRKVPGFDNSLEVMDRTIASTVNKLVKDIASLKDHIEKNDHNSSIAYDYGQDIQTEADFLEKLLFAEDDEDYLVTRLGKKFWEYPNILVGRKIYPPSTNIKQVQQIGEAFRGIKRSANFDDLKDVDSVVQAVSNITESIQGLERIIKAKQEIFTQYYKASATMANFYLRAHEYALQQIIQYGDEDINRVVVDKLQKAWSSITDKMGL